MVRVFSAPKNNMQLQIDIERWLSKPTDFTKGLELFKQSVGDTYYIGLFEKFPDASFTQSKMIDMLREYAKGFEVEEVKELVESRPEAVKPKKHFPQPNPELKTEKIKGHQVPEKIRLLQDEKSVLYKQCLYYRKEMKELLKLKTTGTLSVKEALDIMDKKDSTGRNVPFSLTYVTWSDREQTGGTVISYNKAALAHLNMSGSRVIKTRKIRTLKPSKNPNHWKNGTRNINPEGTWEVRKVHIWLIFELNGKEVTLGNAG
jgi:hypothetical protein